jgi:pimeloyl-ACP methyl ester carboxylesterase
MKDTFVPAENAEFARQKMSNAKVSLIMKDDLDHFVPWTAPELIKASIFRLLPTQDPTLTIKE